MSLDSIGIRPPRASLVNLSTNEQLEFLFNPQTFEERFEAQYNRIQITGLSHARLSYKGTSNNVIPIELYLSQLAQDKFAGTENSAPTILQQKAWLQSLLYPASHQDFGYIGPPQVLFVWPRVLRLIGRIIKATFVHREFSAKHLGTIRLIATLEFEEDVSQRRLMEEVQLTGSLVVGEEV